MQLLATCIAITRPTCVLSVVPAFDFHLPGEAPFLVGKTIYAFLVSKILISFQVILSVTRNVRLVYRYIKITLLLKYFTCTVLQSTIEVI